MITGTLYTQAKHILVCNQTNTPFPNAEIIQQMVGVLHTHSHIWLPKQMCTQTQRQTHTHTQENTLVSRRSVIRNGFKPWAYGHRNWQPNRCAQTHAIRARGERVTPVPSQRTEGPVCAALGSRPHEPQRSVGRGTEVESDAKRGGADGSAIWWMEEKQGR